MSRLFEYIQIDVMDGKLVDNKSFEDIEKINDLNLGLKYELHLMIKNPLSEIKKWDKIKGVFRVIFHIEGDDDPVKTIEKIKEKGWQVGIALNPETPLEKILPYSDMVDLILFMTVHPGKQGSKFTPEVGEKIKEFVKIKNRPLCAVDGSVNPNTIEEISSWGVEIFNVGSAIVTQPNPAQTYRELKKLLK